MIEINHLSKHFGPFRAVDDLSFTVNPGEVLGFLGPNGAGKTTTMRMITGYLTPSSGSVSVFGHDIGKQSRAARSLIGYLPEGAPAYGEMTPLGLLKFIAQLRGISGSQQKKRIEQVVDELRLHEVLTRPVDTLSKGFKRRVGLAQAILHEPPVLVLDEPTDGLDPNQKQQVRNLIEEIAHDRIIIISTHILEEVSAVCSRAIIIAEGKLVADDTPAALEARSVYHGAITVKLSAAGLEADLGKLTWIRQVEVDGRHARVYTIFPQAGAGQPLLQLTEWASREGYGVEELALERGRLDEVFHQLTSPQQEVQSHAG